MRITCPSIVLVACLATACAPAHVVTTPGPAPVAGDRIRYAVRPDSTNFIVARAISLDADRLAYDRFVPATTGNTGQWVAGSLPTDSIARLQVRVGRRGNVGRGALIGGLLGGAAAIACASEEPGWLTPTPGECLFGYTLSGLATGALIGALIRSDVWAPTELPTRRQAQPPTPPPVSAGPVRIGIRLPIRLMSR